VGRTGPEQSGQYLVLAEGEAVMPNDICEATRLEEVQPGDALKDMGRGDVEVGPLSDISAGPEMRAVERVSASGGGALAAASAGPFETTPATPT